MTVRKVMVVALLLAGFVTAVGLVLLVGPVKVTDAQAGAIDCGSAMAPDVTQPLPGAGQDELAVFNRLRGECTDRLDTQRTVAWSLAAAGVVGAGLSGAWLLNDRSRRRAAVTAPTRSATR